jgi:hypothetical protein
MLLIVDHDHASRDGLNCVLDSYNAFTVLCLQHGFLGKQFQQACARMPEKYLTRSVGRWSDQIARAKELLREAQEQYKRFADSERTDQAIYNLVTTLFSKQSTAVYPRAC